MSHSLLIFGTKRNTKEEELFKNISNIKSPDVLVIETEKEKKSIGIEQVRSGIKFLQEKPFELKNKYLIIPQAEKLTTEAQNALLKILEEPPVYAEIRLGTKSELDLLETVISRCKKINLNIGDKKEKSRGEEEKKEESISNNYNYELFRKMDIGNKLDFIEDLAKEEKENILEVLEKWITSERSFITKDKESVEIIKVLVRVKEDLENTNINTKFTLEYLAINTVKRY